MKPNPKPKLESSFQAGLIKKLEGLFHGCLIMKNDSSYRTGIPDLLVMFGEQWALLEVKRSANETPRPNQPWYVEYGRTNSFGAFIYPENEQEVLTALASYFRVL